MGLAAHTPLLSGTPVDFVKGIMQCLPRSYELPRLRMVAINHHRAEIDIFLNDRH
jgi:hypothetical protein